MKTNHLSAFLNFALLSCDIVCLFAGYQFFHGHFSGIFENWIFGATLVLPLLFVLINFLQAAYQNFSKEYSLVVFKKTYRSYLYFLVLFFVCTLALKNVPVSFFRNRYLYVYLFLFLPAMFYSARIGLLLIRKHLRTLLETNKDLIVIGNSRLVTSIKEAINTKQLRGYALAGYYSPEPFMDYAGGTDTKYLGRIDDITSRESFQKSKNIICSVDLINQYRTLDNVISNADNEMLKFYFVPNNFLYDDKILAFDHLQGLPVLSLRKVPLENNMNATKKRMFDIAISLFVIIFILSWLFPVVGLLIKLQSKGPIFFRQQRTGYDNMNFDCLKFRSMTVNKNCDRDQAKKNDARVTGIGAFLRKTSIDEMPQFINVLRGDMSIVGPRPHMLAHTKMYAESINHYMARHFILPGITGWAQVNGCRGETRTNNEMEDRIKRDVWYLENWSFGLDCKIIFMTVLKAIKGDPAAY